MAFCQLQLDPNAGFIMDSERGLGTGTYGLWPSDEQLFLNKLAIRYKPILSLSTALLDSNPFTISSRLNLWHHSDTSAESLKPEALSLDVSASYQLSQGELRFTPSGRLMYSQIDTAELGAPDSHEALTLSLNGEVSYALSQSWGLLLPFASFQWTYQFDTPDGYRWINDMAVQALSLAPEQDTLLSDQDYFNLGVGFSAQFRNGAAGFINYQKLLGHDQVDDYRLRAGFHLEF